MALSDHVHEVEMWLEEGRCLSARWVSCELGVPACAAISLLEEYKQSHSDVGSLYVVSGEASDGRYCINVCTDSQLEVTKAKFARVNSSHIYSIQKSTGSHVFNLIRTADYRQVKEMLGSQNSADNVMKNEHGAVRYNKLEVFHNKKVYPSRDARPAASVAKNPSKIPASIGAAVTGKSSSAVNPSPGSGIKDVVIQSSVVKNFFGAASTASTKKAAKAADAEAERSPPTGSVLEENVDDDGEWDDGSHYETNKNKLRKRKPEAAQATFEERDEASDVVEDDNVSEDRVNEEAPKGPNKFRVFGAMDGFIEDAAIAEHKKGLTAGGVESRPSGSTKRRKLVEKVSCDERGYLVTEMVYEECEADDFEAQPASEPPKKIPSLPKPAAAPAAKSSGSKKEPAKGQKSMMSFFGGKK